MVVGRPEDLPPATVLHRVGGGQAADLRLSGIDRAQDPPGISVLLGGSPQEAAAQMRRAFPGSRKWQQRAGVVGSSTAEAIRQAGFEVVPDPTDRFPNHARLIHPQGAAGFSDENLEQLAGAFQETKGC